MPTKFKTLIHRAFDIGLFLKAFNGVLEICGGVLLLIIKPESISRLVAAITQDELIEDPRDRVANLLVHVAQNLSLKGELLGALYLLVHGIIKILLIAALFKKKLWAYPLAIVVFGLFIMYQLYSYSWSHSVWMLILSIFDAGVIMLTYLEYKNLQ